MFRKCLTPTSAATTIPVALLAACLLACSSCWLFPGKFERNDNVTLLKSERRGRSGYSLTDPQVSPGGASVYFIRRVDLHEPIGTLWRMDVRETTACEVLSDTVTAYAISSMERYVVLAAEMPANSGRLLVLDAAIHRLETLQVGWSPIYFVALTKSEPPTVYFNAHNGGVYRIGLDGSGETLVSPSLAAFLTSEWADSVILPWLTHDHRFSAAVVYVPDGVSERADISVTEAGEADTSLLSAGPYKWALIRSPCWTPDGNGLVYSASEPYKGLDLPAELWTYRPVFPDGAR